MGTDIHLYPEIRKDGKWVYADAEVLLKDEAPDVFAGSTHPVKAFSWRHGHRNYDFFAILADVRNGAGFAGCDTGDGFVPISNPKGLPEDMSEEVRAQYSEGCYHDMSWLTLREILEYDWNRFTNQRGWVCEEAFKDWKVKGKPNSWSGGVSGGGVAHLTNEEMSDLISGERIREKGKTYYTQVEWPESYIDAVHSKSLAHFVAALMHILLNGKFDPKWSAPECLTGFKPVDPKSIPEKASDVRIVFWFDS